MKTSNRLFSFDTVDKYIADVLIPEGYEVGVLDGVLVDSYVCYAPDDKHYNIIFAETYLNEWSSALAVHKCKRIGKSEQAWIDAHKI